MDPERGHGTVAGTIWTYIIAVVGLIIIFWVTSLFIDDDPPGRCRTELGYMGQVEVVECEPDEAP